MNIRRSRYAMLEDLFVGSDDEAGFYDERNSISRYALPYPRPPMPWAGTLMICPCSI